MTLKGGLTLPFINCMSLSNSVNFQLLYLDILMFLYTVWRCGFIVTYPAWEWLRFLNLCRWELTGSSNSTFKYFLSGQNDMSSGNGFKIRQQRNKMNKCGKILIRISACHERLSTLWERSSLNSFSYLSGNRWGINLTEVQFLHIQDGANIALSTQL